MKPEFKLDTFEGPLDLLLHLIEKNKVNIYDIPIVEITNQYMAYIHEMEEFASMDSMSEFLVMAATLLQIKSRMLLPKPVEDAEEEDPREELVQRLMEYKMFKYAAGELKDLSVDAGKIFYKPESVPKEIREYEEPVDPAAVVGDVTLTRLHDVFRMVMRRKNDREDQVHSRFGSIERERYKVEDRIEEIGRQIRGLRRINFRTLLDVQPTKGMVIVTFLAVLEMIKAGQVSVSQEENFADIYMDAT